MQVAMSLVLDAMRYRGSKFEVLRFLSDMTIQSGGDWTFFGLSMWL